VDEHWLVSHLLSKPTAPPKASTTDSFTTLWEVRKRRRSKSCSAQRLSALVSCQMDKDTRTHRRTWKAMPTRCIPTDDQGVVLLVSQEGNQCRCDVDFDDIGEFHGVLIDTWNDIRKKDPSFGTGANRVRADPDVLRLLFKPSKEVHPSRMKMRSTVFGAPYLPLDAIQLSVEKPKRPIFSWITVIWCSAFQMMEKNSLD